MSVEEIVEEVISELQLNFTSYFQYKFFVETIEAILTDQEGLDKVEGGLYCFLGTKTKEDPDTIKSRIRTIKNRLGPKELERLGFKKAPKNKELLFKIAEITKNKVGTDDEHKT